MSLEEPLISASTSVIWGLRLLLLPTENGEGQAIQSHLGLRKGSLGFGGQAGPLLQGHSGLWLC
jgi:hypothetical protein